MPMPERVVYLTGPACREHGCVRYGRLHIHIHYGMISTVYLLLEDVDTSDRVYENLEAFDI